MSGRELRRASRGALARIEALLGLLRDRPELEERRHGVFFLAGAELLHFHEVRATGDEGEEGGAGSGLVADVRLAGGVVRMPVDDPGEQAELLGCVDERLEATVRESPRRGAGARPQRRPRRD